MEKKEWPSALFVAIVTAVITSILTVIVNKLAFDDTKKQAKYEHKVKAIETFSKVAMNMIILFRSMDNVHLQENKFLIDYVKGKHSDDPFSDIKNDTLVNSSVNALADAKMQKQDTAIYHRYLKASAYWGDYYSAYYSMVSFFEKTTQDKARSLDTLMQINSYQAEVIRQMTAKKITSLKLVNWGDVDDSLWTKRTDKLKKLLQSMSNLD